MRKQMLIYALALGLMTPIMTPIASIAAQGEEIYGKVCSRCHGPGTGGAPKYGDVDAWKERIEKGKEVLYDHAINGFKAMPAKGGKPDLKDEDVKSAVDYMTDKSS